MVRPFSSRLTRTTRLNLDLLEDRTTPASFQGLGLLPGGTGSEALLISANGLVVCGAVLDSGSNSQAFRWTENGGMVAIPGIAGGQFHNYADGISADGSVIFGLDQFYGRAFRWTEPGG